MTGTTIEDALATAVRAAVEPLAAEVGRLRGELEALRRALPPTLLDLREAADKLGVSVSTVRRQIREGAIPVRRFGRSVRVDAAALRPTSEGEIASLAREARAPKPSRRRNGPRSQ